MGPKIGQRDLLTPAGTPLTPRSAGRSPQKGFLGLKSGASSPRKDQSPVPNTYVFEKLGRSNKAGVALSEGGRSKSPMKDQFLRVDRSQERSKSQDRSRGKSPSQERSKSQDRSRGKSPMKDQFVRGGRSKSPGGGRELSRDRDRKRQDGLSKSPKNDRDHSKSPKKHPSPKRNSPFLRRDTSAPTKGRFLMPNNDSAGKIPATPTIDRKLPTPVPF